MISGRREGEEEGGEEEAEGGPLATPPLLHPFLLLLLHLDNCWVRTVSPLPLSLTPSISRPAVAEFIVELGHHTFLIVCRFGCFKGEEGG